VLSPSFNERLKVRIQEEKRSCRPMLMQAYWLTVSFISLLIFLTIKINITNSATGLTLLLSCFAVPILFLCRMLHFSPLDLILDSMNNPKKRISTKSGELMT
jgi:hypothetical protein